MSPSARFRRTSPVAEPPGEGLLTEATAVARPGSRELVVMPPKPTFAPTNGDLETRHPNSGISICREWKVQRLSYQHVVNLTCWRELGGAETPEPAGRMPIRRSVSLALGYL